MLIAIYGNLTHYSLIYVNFSEIWERTGRIFPPVSPAPCTLHCYFPAAHVELGLKRSILNIKWNSLNLKWGEQLCSTRYPYTMSAGVSCHLHSPLPELLVLAYASCQAAPNEMAFKKRVRSGEKKEKNNPDLHHKQNGCKGALKTCRVPAHFNIHYSANLIPVTLE